MDRIPPAPSSSIVNQARPGTKWLPVRSKPSAFDSLLAIHGDSVTFTQALIFLGLHVPLMLIFRAVPFVATIHSLFVLGIGIYFLSRDKEPIRVAWVIAYLAGAEISWRGVNATLIWEYGKYVTILLSILIMLKFRSPKKVVFWPILFISLLIPSIFISPVFDRTAISFQLAGPVAIGVATMAFSTIEFKKTDIERLFLAIIAPTITMAFLSFFLLSTNDITFSGGGANEAVTDGIGANQVTSALSFGATAAFFYIFLGVNDWRTRWLMIGIAIGLTMISVITFSRSGLWNTVGSVLTASFFLLRDRLRRSRLLTFILQLSAIGYFVLFPYLLNLTEGALLDRYSDLDTTGRDVLFQIDYQLFLDNPFLGVGVGYSPFYHVSVFGYAKPTHTEYSRLLAEHGVLGASAIALLLGVALARAFSRRTPISKGFSVGFTIWGLLYMTHSATRLVVPSVALALAAADFIADEDPAKTSAEAPSSTLRRLPEKHLRGM